jgi:hypothetical protein
MLFKSKYNLNIQIVIFQSFETKQCSSYDSVAFTVSLPVRCMCIQYNTMNLSLQKVLIYLWIYIMLWHVFSQKKHNIAFENCITVV